MVRSIPCFCKRVNLEKLWLKYFEKYPEFSFSLNVINRIWLKLIVNAQATGLLT